MKEFDKVYDITITLDENCPPFPGDPPFVRRDLTTIENGDPAYVSTFSMTAHSGTHLDLPSHFFGDRPKMEHIPVSSFILPAVVADLPDKSSIRTVDIESSGAAAGDALLLRTDNSTSGLVREAEYSDDYTYITPEAAAACAKLQLALLGIDYFSVDPPGDENYPVHRQLLEAGLLILERIDLAEVPAGRYTLISLPLKAAGAEASPVRAVLLA